MNTSGPAGPHWNEGDVTLTLQSISATSYAAMPAQTEQRLEAVLESLPAATNLSHIKKPGLVKQFKGRLAQPLQTRLAVVSIAFGTLVLVFTGVLITQLTFNGVSQTGNDTAASDAGGSQEDALAESDDQALPESAGGADSADESGASDSEEAGGLDFGAEGKDGPDNESDSDNSFGPDGMATDDPDLTIARFSSQTVYGSDESMLKILKELQAESKREPNADQVPAELVALIEDNTLWEACHDAIIEEYGSLPVVVDFATYNDKPAIVAMLVSNTGEMAVAVGEECANGEIVELYEEA